jgi:Carboxypeptidase C (cathepsin A)
MKLKQLSTLLILGSLFSQTRSLPADTAVVTYHRTNISGQKVEYSVTTGTQPVWSDTSNKPIAALHYTYYERTDVANKTKRPIMISFNGGPGSGSVWMHMAYTGPMVLNVDKEGFPLQPYGVKSNPYSVLDVTDIVYVNPVNTGYSRIVDKKVKREKFFGVTADINYLAEWINTFIQRNNRWESPNI